MKIKIVDWNKFEKNNAIYFTRDINIVNEFNVYAIEIGKKEKNLLVYMDFISFKHLGFIKLDNCIELIDNRIDNDWIFKDKFVCEILVDNLYIQKYKFENMFASSWMFSSTFFADLTENPVKAEEEFFKKINNEF